MGHLSFLNHPKGNVMRCFWLSLCPHLRICEMNVIILIPVTNTNVAGHYWAQWIIFTPPCSLSKILGNIKHDAKRSIIHLFTTNKDIVTRVDILTMYIPRNLAISMSIKLCLIILSKIHSYKINMVLPKKSTHCLAWITLTKNKDISCNVI